MNDQTLPELYTSSDKTIKKATDSPVEPSKSRKSRKSRKSPTKFPTLPLTTITVDPKLLKELRETADQIINDPNNSYTRKRVVNATTIILR